MPDKRKNKIAQLALCAPLSGRAAALGKEMQHAVAIAVEEHRVTVRDASLAVELLIFDDEGSVAKASQIATAILREPSIVAVIGHYGSDTSLAAAKILSPAGVPMVSPIASNPQLTMSSLQQVFRYTNRDDHTAAAICTYLTRMLHKQRAVVVRSDTAYGHSMASAFEKAFKAAGGGIAASITVEEGQVIFDKLIRGLPWNFDMVFYGGTYEGAPLLRALRLAGYPQLMATGDGCWDIVNFLRPAGKNAEQGEGVLVLSASSAVGDNQGSMAFAAKYEARYGPIINYALNAYDAACLLLDAVDAAFEQDGQPLAAAVTAALRQIHFRGTANANLLHWDDKGDHSAAITRLNIVKAGKFREIALIPG